MTREEVVARYGPIDFASRYWPNKNRFITMVEIPESWFPNWKVMNTDLPVRHIACNIDMMNPLLWALSEVFQTNQGPDLLTFDGCFNIRQVRGGRVFSAHSYGLAIDLNAATNALGSTEGGFYDQPILVECFKNAGFTWGGDFRGRKDPMHFSLAGF